MALKFGYIYKVLVTLMATGKKSDGLDLSMGGWKTSRIVNAGKGSGYPRHRENRENGQNFAKTQGFCLLKL